MFFMDKKQILYSESEYIKYIGVDAGVGGWFYICMWEIGFEGRE